MRRTGILRSWNAERGFGFIAPTQGGREIFVHVSALPRDGTRPAEGETLSYDIGPGRDGKQQALNVHRQAIGRPELHAGPSGRTRARAKPSSGNGSVIRTITFVGFVLVMLASAYRHFTRPAPDAPATLVEFLAPAPAAAAPVARTQRMVEASTPAYQCDGRRFCSQMTSCAEATYFLKHCPNTQMDGDHDGVPCETQWCASSIAR